MISLTLESVNAAESYTDENAVRELLASKIEYSDNQKSQAKRKSNSLLNPSNLRTPNVN